MFGHLFWVQVEEIALISAIDFKFDFPDNRETGSLRIDKIVILKLILYLSP